MKVINLESTAPIVEKFVQQLMENQGTHLKVPMKPNTIISVISDQPYEIMVHQIWKQTQELLTMMGISYETNEGLLSIMINPAAIPPAGFNNET